MRFPHISALSLGLSILQAIAAPVEDDDIVLRQLTDNNFRSSTSQGLWWISGAYLYGHAGLTILQAGGTLFTEM